MLSQRISCRLYKYELTLICIFIVLIRKQTAISGAFTPVQKPYKVRAGDTFRTTCFYKSDQDIPFGNGSLDEMCIDFVYYYPKVLPSHCGASGEGSCFSTPKRVKTPDKCMNRKFGTDPYFFCPLFGSGEKKTQSDYIFGSGRSLQFSQLFELSQFQCCPEPE